MPPDVQPMSVELDPPTSSHRPGIRHTVRTLRRLVAEGGCGDKGHSRINPIRITPEGKINRHKGREGANAVVRIGHTIGVQRARLQNRVADGRTVRGKLESDRRTARSQ